MIGTPPHSPPGQTAGRIKPLAWVGAIALALGLVVFMVATQRIRSVSDPLPVWSGIPADRTMAYFVLPLAVRLVCVGGYCALAGALARFAVRRPGVRLWSFSALGLVGAFIGLCAVADRTIARWLELHGDPGAFAALALILVGAVLLAVAAMRSQPAAALPAGARFGGDAWWVTAHLAVGFGAVAAMLTRVPYEVLDPAPGGRPTNEIVDLCLRASLIAGLVVAVGLRRRAGAGSGRLSGYLAWSIMLIVAVVFEASLRRLVFQHFRYDSTLGIWLGEAGDLVSLVLLLLWPVCAVGWWLCARGRSRAAYAALALPGLVALTNLVVLVVAGAFSDRHGAEAGEAIYAIARLAGPVGLVASLVVVAAAGLLGASIDRAGPTRKAAKAARLEAQQAAWAAQNAAWAASGGHPPAAGYREPGGYPTPGGYPPVGAAAPTNGLAIASLVIAVTGAGAVLAVIFGHIARSQIRRSGERGAGMALAGLIIGYIAIGAALAAVLILLIVASQL